MRWAARDRDLLLWSMVGIYSELAFVRLYSTLAGGVAYYSNLILLFGIVSLAAGMMAPRLSRWAPAIPALFVVPAWFARWLSGRNLLSQMSGEFLWSAVARVYPLPADFDLHLAIILLCLAMIPGLLLVGASQARAFLAHETGVRPYLVAAFGGVAGSAAFLVQNRMAPSLLMLIVLWVALLAVPLLLDHRRVVPRVVAVAGLLVLTSEGVVSSIRHLWSPYQRIDVVLRPDIGAIHALSNGFFIMHVSVLPVAKIPPQLRSTGALAFDATMREGDRVLVLGSGGGTDDVREALHHGAASVTAVEIDRAFVELGREVDPEATYDDQRVRVVIDDARAFLTAAEEKYDVVYLSYLDSQTNASNHSRFRLDSFLYTREGLERAWSRLREDGVLLVSFATGTPWIRERLYDTLATAVDCPVRVFQIPGQLQSVFLASRGNRNPRSLGGAWEETTRHFENRRVTQIATDDWPFLYSQTRTIPMEHLRLLLTLLIMVAALLLAARGRMTGDIRERYPVAEYPLRVYALLSGAGFFFIELRTISALTPVLGSTYDSQGLVVIGILLSSVAGGVLAALYPLRTGAAWAALFAVIAVNLGAPSWSHPYRGTVFPSAAVFISLLLLPTFLSGYLYVLYLRGRDSDLVLSMQRWNYLGGAVGGMSEAVVVIVGFERSAYVAASFYGAALVAALVGTPPRGRFAETTEVPCQLPGTTVSPSTLA